MGRDEDKVIRLSAIQANKKTFICLGVNQDVIAGSSMQAMPEYFIGAMMFIQSCVKQGLVVHRPNNITLHIIDCFS